MQNSLKKKNKRIQGELYDSKISTHCRFVYLGGVCFLYGEEWRRCRHEFQDSFRWEKRVRSILQSSPIGVIKGSAAEKINK